MIILPKLDFPYWAVAFVLGGIPLIWVFGYELWLWQTEATQPWGCKKLGMQEPSNLADEEDDTQYASETEPDSWRIKALLIHPVKSCSAVELDTTDITATGPRYDRQFAFAQWVTPKETPGMTEEQKKPKWEFVTLRDKHFLRLVLVKPEIWIPDPSVTPSKHEDYIQNMSSRGVLVIKYPRPSPTRLQSLLIQRHLLSPYKSFRVPLFPPKNHTYPSETVRIWKDFPVWLNYGRHVPADFKTFLGLDAEKPFTLFRADPASFRPVFRNAPRKESLGYQPIVAFADAYPLHLMNLASVRDVARRVHDTIPHFTTRRFRPNLVITGPRHYDEDTWKRVRIGGQEYHCACHCIRCKLPNVDPDTGVADRNEPYTALGRYRKVDPGERTKPCLGLQLVPAAGAVAGEKEGGGGRIRVGDRVEVLERGELVYIPQGT